MAAPAGTGALVGQQVGKYSVLALLALGGTAEIYLARIDGSNGFEKYVVIKVLHEHLADDQEFVKMFLDEARLAAQLDHSNIVQTLELGDHHGRYYMVLEFLAGLSLAMIIRRFGERHPDRRLPIPVVLGLVSQACAGLHYAHQRASGGVALNVVHRDISPQNLVVSFEGVVKLVDFGIARAEQRETRTKAGTIKGKFAYMSPEQCVSVNVDRRTDVFALGIVLHELLTGRRLFKRANQYDTYQAVIECKVPAPSSIAPDVPAELDDLTLRALAKVRDQRYASAEEFADALLGYMHRHGLHTGAGEIGRFLEDVFAKEVEEHGARMRELLEGRQAAAAEASWDDGDEAAEVEIGGDDELVAVDLDGARAPDPDATDDADLPEGGERTRIELNPLELLDKVASGPTPPAAPPAQAAPAPGLARKEVPLIPTVIDDGDQARRAARPPASPDPARRMNTPPPMDLDASPELAQTALGAPLVDPGHGASGGGAAAGAWPGPTASGGYPQAPVAHGGGYPDPNAPNSGGYPAPNSGGYPAPNSGGYPAPNSGGYPAPNSGGYPAPNSGGYPAPNSGGYPAPGGPQPERPSGDLVYPPRPLPTAANLVSPAPHGYYGDQRLADVAQREVKPVPPWLLGVLFAGALGLALGLTVLIAKIAS
ncbi:MAG: protein kinase [Kofleriaceae bacterium]|nr:protein kinase [Kofleriaceae bacterium]MBP6837676.1 protein kinase [Kofleriaceae bacterium]MBP9203613.1 protein kinase [Kofleriaceae bacterium]